MQENYMHLIILCVGVYYLYKSVMQIIRKDFEFYNREKYTEESAARWCVIDGILKTASAVVFCAYGGFGCYGYNLLWVTIVLLVIIIALNFYLHDKVLVKKPDQP